MSRYMDEDEKERKYHMKCPKCGTDWTKTPKLATSGFYWHCLLCSKKAEDLVIPPIPKDAMKSASSEDLLQEFEDLLGNWDDDDNWDFF